MRRGNLEVVQPNEKHCQSVHAVHCKKINNGVITPLRQRTAMLPTGRCHITLPPWKICPLRCGLLSKFFDLLLRFLLNQSACCFITDQFSGSGRVMVRYVCVPVTFGLWTLTKWLLNWIFHLTCRFILILTRSYLKVKVTGQSSWSEEESVAKGVGARAFTSYIEEWKMWLFL